MTHGLLRDVTDLANACEMRSDVELVRFESETNSTTPVTGGHAAKKVARWRSSEPDGSGSRTEKFSCASTTFSADSPSRKTRLIAASIGSTRRLVRPVGTSIRETFDPLKTSLLARYPSTPPDWPSNAESRT